RAAAVEPVDGVAPAAAVPEVAPCAAVPGVAVPAVGLVAESGELEPTAGGLLSIEVPPAGAGVLVEPCCAIAAGTVSAAAISAAGSSRTVFIGLAPLTWTRLRGCAAARRPGDGSRGRRDWLHGKRGARL